MTREEWKNSDYIVVQDTCYKMIKCVPPVSDEFYIHFIVDGRECSVYNDIFNYYVGLTEAEAKEQYPEEFI